MKKVIVFGVIILVIVGVAFIVREIIYRNKYMYMPREYEQTEVFFPEWDDLETPIRLEISDDGFRDSYVFIEDSEDVEFVISELQKSEFVSRSRQEFNELEFVNDSYGYDEGYELVIRADLGEENERIIFQLEMYPEEDYIAFGVFYYFYTISDELREYLINTFE